jgi:hypothetical protein
MSKIMKCWVPVTTGHHILPSYCVSVERSKQEERERNIRSYKGENDNT